MAAADRLAGRQVKCPMCGQDFTIVGGRLSGREIDSLLADHAEAAQGLQPLCRPRRRWRAPWRRWLARHSAWVVPVAACVVFAVLIAGALGVRKIVIRLWRGADAAQALVERGGANATATTDFAAPGGDGDVVLQSSEPGYDVLPPPAAKQPGRTLPKMLLVGPHKEMFPTVSEALTVAVPGDIIEIRTNGPLVEGGAELRVNQKVKDAPLVIRAGLGFQPVVRGGVAVANVDIKVVGIHFALAGLSVEDGNALLERCTVTKGGLGFRSSRHPEKPLDIVIDQCFVRHFWITSSGSGIALTIRNSGFCDSGAGGGHVAFDSVEDNALFVHQSTFVQVYFLQLDMGKEPPRNGFGFRMERSVFGTIWAAPSFVNLRVPESYVSRGLSACEEAFRGVFREFSTADNLTRYYEPATLSVWSTGSGGPSHVIGWDVPPSFAPDDPTLRFGKRIEEARFLMWEKGDSLGANRLLAAALPEDLAVTSTGPLAPRTKQGIRYGCDVTQLPVPPPVTLELAGLVATPAPVATKAAK